MSTDSLLHHFDDIRFTAEEQDVVYASLNYVVVPADDPRLSLVGRVITNHFVEGATLIRVFRAVWKHDKVLFITELRPNFFLIRLVSESVRAYILKRGPWVFNKDWFAILSLDHMLSIDEYYFTRMVIWVCILRVLIGLIAESLGRSLGACIGTVVGIDTCVIDGNMGEFLRVRVNLDTTKPLRCSVTLGGCENRPKMCNLQYERLPNFCHGCRLANLKKNQENPAPPKGRIRFHEEGDSSNSQSDFSTLCDDLVFGGVLFTTDFTPAAFVDAAPICAFPEPAPVSSPCAFTRTEKEEMLQYSRKDDEQCDAATLVH
ncbi:hypothetical protein GQ457_09G021670 [Hibiscus cannabinus]